MTTKEEKKKSEKISIKKYEGHTEGPWWINHEDGDGATSIWNGTIDEGNMNHVADVDAHKNDLKLMADAPEILQALVDEQEKVKRLREQFRLAYSWVDYQFPDGGISDFAKYIGDEEE